MNPPKNSQKKGFRKLHLWWKTDQNVFESCTSGGKPIKTQVFLCAVLLSHLSVITIMALINWIHYDFAQERFEVSNEITFNAFHRNDPHLIRETRKISEKHITLRHCNPWSNKASNQAQNLSDRRESFSPLTKISGEVARMHKLCSEGRILLLPTVLN